MLINKDKHIFVIVQFTFLQAQQTADSSMRSKNFTSIGFYNDTKLTRADRYQRQLTKLIDELGRAWSRGNIYTYISAKGAREVILLYEDTRPQRTLSHFKCSREPGLPSIAPVPICVTCTRMCCNKQIDLLHI